MLSTETTASKPPSAQPDTVSRSTRSFATAAQPVATPVAHAALAVASPTSPAATAGASAAATFSRPVATHGRSASATAAA